MADFFRLCFILLTSLLVLAGCNSLQVKKSPPSIKSSQKLTRINQHWNHFIHYQEDSAADHWQSPKETVLRRTGDCEDLAILKMFDTTLNYLYPKAEIRLAYVHADAVTPHMVLIVGLENERWVLDNLNDEVRLLQDTGYSPVYELDQTGKVYQGGEWLKRHKPFQKFESILSQYNKPQPQATLLASRR